PRARLRRGHRGPRRAHRPDRPFRPEARLPPHARRAHEKSRARPPAPDRVAHASLSRPRRDARLRSRDVPGVTAMAIPKSARMVAARMLGPDTRLLEFESSEPLGFVGVLYVMVDT